MSDQQSDNSEAAREPDTREAAAAPDATGVVPPPPPVPPAPPAPAAPADPAPVGPPPPVVAGASPASSESSISPATKQHILSGLSTAGIAVGGALVAGLILALYVVLSAAGALQNVSLPVSTDAFAGFGSLLLLAFTFAGLVFGGELNVQISSALGGFGGAGGQLWLFPLTLTAAVLVLVLWWSVRQERTSPLPGIRRRLLFSGAVGLTASLVLLLLAFVLAVRQGGEGVEVVISGVSYRVVLFGTVFIAGTVLLGRIIGARAPAGANWIRAIGGGIAALPRFVREALVYTAGLTVVFGLITLVVGTILLWDPLGVGALPLVFLALLNLTGIPTVLGHLGGLGISSGFGGYGSGETVTIVSTGGWSWLLLVIAVLFSTVAAVWIGTRRGRNVGLNLAEAWKFPVIVLGAWVLHGVFTFGLTVQAGGAVGVFGGGGAAGVSLALWTPLVFLLWAVVIELGAQYLPAFVYALSPGLHAFLAGRRAVQTWAAGPPAAPAAAPAAFAGSPGAPSPEPGAPSPREGSPTPVAPPKPLSAGAKKGILWSAIGVGAVALLGIGGAVAVSVVNSTRTAEAVALTYLSHIEDGNATAANALVDPNVSSAARTHLTDEVLESATERISDVSVRSSASSSGDETYVEVSFKLDGVTQSSSLTARRGEPEWLVLDTWEIVTPLVQSVNIDVEGSGSLSIGGEPLTLDDESSYRTGEVALYPGVYEVATDDGSLFELDETQLLVTVEQTQSVHLQFTPTQKLVDEVQNQVNALLDTCAASTAARSDGCPLRVFVYPSDTPVTWAIVTYPTVELSADGTSFRASEGEATASYTETFFGTSRDDTDEVSLSFYGEVEISGDDVTVSYEY